MYSTAGNIISGRVSERFIKSTNREVYDFINKYIDLDSSLVKVVDTASRFNIESLEEYNPYHIVNIKRINDIRFANKFFESVNNILPDNGYFICSAETNIERRNKILKGKPFFISYPNYFLDFIFKRVFPKWKPTYKLYYLITKGRNRVFTLPELLGRLVSCGFRIVKYKEINNHTYFITQKKTEPAYDMKPSYGPLFKMKRIGKGGKIISVYKLRTMHPYAEYLQNYIYENNELDEGGKFRNDFRVTSWGRVLRKLWIDELPMLINWLKGDLKLVGVRPLSQHYFSIYSEELRKRRIKYKPGLVPPYYADLPKTLEDIMASELRYLDAYEKAPFKTDVKYFFKAWYNIIVKKARSG